MLGLDLVDVRIFWEHGNKDFLCRIVAFCEIANIDRKKKDDELYYEQQIIE